MEGNKFTKRTGNCFVCDHPGHLLTAAHLNEQRVTAEANLASVNQVNSKPSGSAKLLTAEDTPNVGDLLDLLMYNSEDEQVILVHIPDQGCSANGAVVQNQSSSCRGHRQWVRYYYNGDRVICQSSTERPQKTG